ncbi:PQQ-dependent sugar dehydrogenase [Aeromicrobium sp. CTD01-1L150]|uniref:PQQ-dependent sugar dehydrogenase n=1 Tax=Aeromicrobium sp. CTD01-1L150 TaxID=3341830 RepID=UPI0035C138E1
MVARRTFLTGTAALGALALVGCRDDESSAPPVDGQGPSPDPETPQSIDPSVAGTVVDGLNVPWSIAFLASGDALVSQRDDAEILRVSPDGETTSVGAVPGEQVRTGAEGGLLGLAIDPDDETSLYAYLTTPVDNRVVRMRLEDDVLSDPVVVVEGIPLGVNNHQGGRLLFDGDGALFISTGDAGNADLAQDRDSLAGKILRVDRDGEPVDDNPFGTRVWSYGHRNVQGLALDADGRLWASEFGAQERDELNLVEKGGNHGWPLVEGESDDPDLVAPQVTWGTDECSPAGTAITRGTVFLGALRGERLWAVPIGEDGADERGVGEPRALLEGEYGRIRDVVVAPDDSLWISTSNTDGRGDQRDGDDRILRVTL